jgi:hypothetical protein
VNQAWPQNKLQLLHTFDLTTFDGKSLAPDVGVKE